MPTTYSIMKTSQQKRPRKGAFIICEKCGKEFYVYKSRIEKANPRFCSNKCYDKTAENNPNWRKPWKKSQRDAFYANPNRPKFKSDSTNPNRVRFVDNESFWGSTLSWYAKYLPIRIGKCEICGFSDKRILQVHHKDKNRKHNTRDNLVLLCPNCHALEHWLDKSGMYKWRITGNPDKSTIKNMRRGKHGQLIGK